MSSKNTGNLFLKKGTNPVLQKMLSGKDRFSLNVQPLLITPPKSEHFFFDHGIHVTEPES